MPWSSHGSQETLGDAGKILFNTLKFTGGPEILCTAQSNRILEFTFRWVVIVLYGRLFEGWIALSTG